MKDPLRCLKHLSKGLFPNAQGGVRISAYGIGDRTQTFILYVRYCQINTMPCVEKKDLLEPDHKAVILLGSECCSLAELGRVLYRRGQAMGEGKSLWFPIICDHQMEQVNMPG
jgi:hypothetical protein